jgi:hypothetical protein
MIVDKVSLLALILKISGLAGGVVWIDDPLPTASGALQAQIKLKLSSFAGNGVDETRFTYTAGSPGTLDTTQVGNRNIVLSVRAECYRRSAEAGELLDRIRTRLKRNSSLQTLLGLNLAIQTMAPTAYLPTTYDNRVLSVASMDVMLGGVQIDDISNDTDPSGEGETWIDTVDGDNQIPGTIT